MKKDCAQHLTAVVIHHILKYGVFYTKRFPDMINYWEGPLEENGVFLHKGLFCSFFTKARAKKTMAMLDLEIHPLFDRDFFQGLVDGLGNKNKEFKRKRIDFLRRPELRKFLESSEHPFPIKFFKEQNKKRNRTHDLPFFYLPVRGKLDQYFAGVLSSGEVCMRDEEVFCRVSNNCKSNLDKLGILYTEDDDYLLISPFYIMIFCGDLPLSIFSKWNQILDVKEYRYMKTACLDALANWYYTFKRKRIESGYIPYLKSRNFYYAKLGVKMDKFVEEIENKVDFLDERVKNRIKRWYNLSSQN